MPPFFNLPIGPSGHSVRHGKTRSPKADLTTLLKMRRATQVHHEHARLSDRANVSHVRLSVWKQILDYREGVAASARPAETVRSARAYTPATMNRSAGDASRLLSRRSRWRGTSPERPARTTFRRSVSSGRCERDSGDQASRSEIRGNSKLLQTVEEGGSTHPWFATVVFVSVRKNMRKTGTVRTDL